MPPVQGNIVFDNVTFRYAPNGAAVLDRNQPEVQAGQTMALVGETGAGKSTLVRLISRFYETSEGTLRIDGHDMRA